MVPNSCEIGCANGERRLLNPGQLFHDYLAKRQMPVDIALSAHTLRHSYN